MGTVLSLSPRSRKAAACGPERLAAESREEAEEAEEAEEEVRRRKKRHPVLLQVLGWKKQLVSVHAKRKSGKKVKPALQEAEPRERAGTSRTHGSVPVPPANAPEQEAVLSPRKVLVQASTGELLRCLAVFVCRRCVKLKNLSSNQIVLWFRNVDRTLLVQGWQEKCFLSPAGLVFVYLLCRHAVDEDTASEQELHATFLTCLYLAYSYLGTEISYPLKPFLVESSRDAFWERALQLIQRLSGDMLRMNAEPRFFTQVFQDLKRHGDAWERQARQQKRHRGDGGDDLDR